MKNLKKTLLVSLSLVLVAALAVGMTLAYLQDTDSDVNVMTMGNVSIEQIEQERDENGNLVPFKQAKPALPAVGTVAYDDETVTISGKEYNLFGEKLKNVVDKIVTVKNTGKTDAYFRTIIAIEDPFPIELVSINVGSSGYTGSKWFSLEIDGVTYSVKAYTYDEILEPGETSLPSLLQAYIPSFATNEDCAKLGDTWDIRVLTQAVQAAGFEAEGTTRTAAQVALDTAFGAVDKDNIAEWFKGTVVPDVVTDGETLNKTLAAGNSVVMNKNIEYQGSQCVYCEGDTRVNGTTLDGNGKVLNVTKPEKPNDKGIYDYTAITTTGGTIKNLTIEEGFRAICLVDLTEDVYLENLKLGGDVCYTINTGANQEMHDLIVTDSVINGWSSFNQLASASFTGCSFGQGSYYTDESGRLLKPYVNTTVTDCAFIDGYYLDLSSLNEGCKVTFSDCTVGGVALTESLMTASHDWNDYKDTYAMFVELPAGRTLADCVIFK